MFNVIIHMLTVLCGIEVECAMKMCSFSLDCACVQPVSEQYSSCLVRAEYSWCANRTALLFNGASI